jgi:hypothetical protein
MIGDAPKKGRVIDPLRLDKIKHRRWLATRRLVLSI